MTVHVESNTQLTLEQERVYRLRQALERDGGTPGGFLELLAAVVSDNTWQQIPSGINNDAPFTSFKEFIEAKPPFGLGHSAADVHTLLKIRHPREAVADVRAKLDATRAEVARLLAIDGVTDYTEDQRAHEIRSWSSLDQSGGWWLGFFVACQVRPGEGGAGAASDRFAGRPAKMSARRFAELAKTSPSRVMRYYRAWDAAFDAGIVTTAAADLYPGHEPIELPAETEWSNFYSSRKSEPTPKGALISATADALGQAATGIPSAMREAILTDAGAAEAARTALLERMSDDAALQAVVARSLASQPALRKALATESRRADQVEYVRKIAHQGSARTPAGLMIELPGQAKTRAVEQLRLVESSSADPDVVAVAYEAVQALIADLVETDPDIHTREQRSKLQKALHTTARSISTIDPRDLVAVADDDLREVIVALQRQINELATLFASARDERPSGGDAP